MASTEPPVAALKLLRSKNRKPVSRDRTSGSCRTPHEALAPRAASASCASRQACRMRLQPCSFSSHRSSNSEERQVPALRRDGLENRFPGTWRCRRRGARSVASNPKAATARCNSRPLTGTKTLSSKEDVPGALTRRPTHPDTVCRPKLPTACVAVHN